MEQRRAATELRTVLAIGIDAAEPTFVLELIDRGELPTLGRLMRGGVWGEVGSPACLGSGAVWPTFSTGTSPFAHGLYGEWSWQPSLMSLTRQTYAGLVPFWRTPASDGRRVVALDVPFAPVLRLPGLFEIQDWGAHDWLGGRTEVWPSDWAQRLRLDRCTHPFVGRWGEFDHDDFSALGEIVSSCVEGARLRGALAESIQRDLSPELFLLVFTEVHRSAHHLWHLVDSGHPAHADSVRRAPSVVRTGLRDIFQEIDRQIGRLVDAAGEKATVLIFSLHGMKPAVGVPNLVAPLFERLGLVRSRTWSKQSWSERRTSAVARAKGVLPRSAKRWYYRSVSRRMTARFAQPSMSQPAVDWSRTDAIALPTDQHGWVRINLRAREVEGHVRAEDYGIVCQRLTGLLRELKTHDGEPVVQEVLQLAAMNDGVPPLLLPDLVVHWDSGTIRSPLRLRQPALTVPVIGLKFTGQHAFDGFFIFRPGTVAASEVPPRFAAEHMGEFLLGLLG